MRRWGQELWQQIGNGSDGAQRGVQVQSPQGSCWDAKQAWTAAPNWPAALPTAPAASRCR